MAEEGSRPLGREQALDARIEELEREISALEVPYERAMKRSRGDDKEWNEKADNIFGRIVRLVKQFKIGDNGEKAIAIVAQCNVLAFELTAADHIIEQMREKKLLLDQCYKDRDNNFPGVARQGDLS
jgi:hypothetical protein